MQKGNGQYAKKEAGSKKKTGRMQKRSGQYAEKLEEYAKRQQGVCKKEATNMCELTSELVSDGHGRVGCGVVEVCDSA